jgi:hypothetical protein
MIKCDRIWQLWNRWGNWRFRTMEGPPASENIYWNPPRIPSLEGVCYLPQSFCLNDWQFRTFRTNVQWNVETFDPIENQVLCWLGHTSNWLNEKVGFSKVFANRRVLPNLERLWSASFLLLAVLQHLSNKNPSSSAISVIGIVRSIHTFIFSWSPNLTCGGSVACTSASYRMWAVPERHLSTSVLQYIWICVTQSPSVMAACDIHPLWEYWLMIATQ